MRIPEKQIFLLTLIEIWDRRLHNADLLIGNHSTIKSMWELLIQNLAKRKVLLDEEELEILKSLFTYRKFRKNQYLLQDGNVAGHETFIIKGLTRTYEVD